MNRLRAVLIMSLTLPFTFAPGASAEECLYRVDQTCVPGPGGIQINGLPQVFLDEDQDLEAALLQLADPRQSTASTGPSVEILRYAVRVECGKSQQSFTCFLLDELGREADPFTRLATIVNTIMDTCEERDCTGPVETIMECVESNCVNHPLIDELRECAPRDCIETQPYVVLVLGLVETALREVAEFCESGDRCNPNRIIEDVEDFVQSARENLCGTQPLAQCVQNALPNLCPSNPVGSTVSVPSGTRDDDGDGVPRIVVQRTRAEVNSDCQLATNPQSPGTVDAPDYDDNDPNQPPPATLACQYVYPPTIAVPAPSTSPLVTEDNDGDGVPSYKIKRQSLTLEEDCTITTGSALPIGFGPDPDDNDPDNPVSQTPCGPLNTYTQLLPNSYSTTDEDDDGIPVVTISQRYYTVESDCNLSSSSGPSVSYALDPDDNDSNNPAPINQPPCRGQERAFWIPLDFQTEDQDGDQVPVYRVVESEYTIGDDCVPRKTATRVNPTEYGDPDDNDSRYPVDPDPEPCPANQWDAPWVPIIEDEDDDGVPVVYRTSTNVWLSPDCTVEYRGLSIHEGYGDLDDNDPLVPVNCFALANQRPRLPTGGSLLVDEDGDGIPRTAYWTAEHHFTPDCQLITSDPRLESIDAPDPDDANPNDPVSITEPCWQYAGTLVPMARVADESDEDMDGVPAFDVEVRWHSIEADCSQTMAGNLATQRLGDPDDDDPNNPLTQEPCDPVAGIHWVPLSYRHEDLDDDGVPLVTIVEHGIQVAPDCGDTPQQELTRDGQQLGDPDDQDPYNPVADPGAICPGASLDCRLVLTAPTGRQRVEDLDGDGVPAAYIEVAGLELRYNPGDPGLGFQEGSESWVRIGGDTDDANPDEPVPRDPKPCEDIQGATLDAPAGYEVLDDDMDGFPRVLVSTQNHQLADDCSLVPIGPVQSTDLGPDPDDNDDTTPIDSATACQDVAGQYRLARTVAVTDGDGDGLPRVTVMERNLVIQGDCSVNQRTDDLEGESVGDPDDADADDPVPRTLTPCAPFAGTQVPVPEGPPTTQDFDNDGVPVVTQSLRWYVIGPDCTLVPSLDSYPVNIGPDPDDQDPFNPLPALTPCQGFDGPRWLAEGHEVRDEDDDGVPLIVVMERRYDVDTDCNVAASDETRDSVVQVGDDDTDPNAPIPQHPAPCSALAPYSLPVPDGSFQLVDEDEDGWPVLHQPTKTAKLTPDCQVTNEPGDDLVLAVDNDDNDPYRPPAPDCQEASPWSIPGDPVITDQDEDGIPQIHARLVEYRLDDECRPYPTGNTTEGARMGDPDDSDPLLPGDLGELCPGQASPCLLGEVSIPTACRIEDQDEDGISSAYLCTQAYRFHSDGSIDSSEPVEFIGPLGDVDDQNPARPIPFYLTDDVWRLSDELLDDVTQVLVEVDEAHKGLLAVVLDASNSTTDQIQHHREHLLQEIQHGISTLARLRDDAETFMACAGTRTDQYAALMDNRITSAANDPSPGNMDALALAATDGAAIHATNLRACNGASQTLDFLYQEVRVLCGQGLHYTGHAGHLLAESKDPVLDLHRLFSPRSNTINETLHACLEAPYQLARQLVAYTETTADRLTRLLLAYTDLVGSDLLDTLRDLLEPKYHDADAPKPRSWSFPFLLLAIALLASSRRWRRR